MIPTESFLTRSMRAHPHGQTVAHILAAAIRAVDPAEAVRRFVKRDGARLVIDGKTYDLKETDRVSILGVGKAALAMAQPLAEMLSDLSPRGLLIPKNITADAPAGFEIQPGGHPIPNENSLLAGKKALAFINGMSKNDLLICLISGGGSALLSAPADGVTLAEMQTLTSELLACGARIDEINTLRKRIDQLKGGGLVKIAYPARIVSLILSDVVGNPLETIASGLTVPDSSASQMALDIIYRYQLQNKISKKILDTLQKEKGTTKQNKTIFAHTQNVLVGSNQLAAQAALNEAKAAGFNTIALGSDWQGEARDIAKSLCAILREQTKRPTCLVAGGETTVTLHGSGAGGRNQELALSAVSELAYMPATMLAALATDGEDGPTDAAGAIVTPETEPLARTLGMYTAEYLANNDSYHFFARLDDLIKPGSTGTNVNDLVFMFKF